LNARSVRSGVWIVAGVNVDQFDHPIRVSAGGGNLQRGGDRAGDGDVLFQHVGLIDQHVGTRRSKALVVEHVFARHSNGDVRNKRDGLGRVADVFVKRAGVVAGRLEWKPSAAVEVERLFARVFRRPDIIAAP